MYQTCRAVLANARHEQVAAERIASHRPNASDPATPAVTGQQKDAEKTGIACPILVGDEKCTNKDCPYSHKKHVIADAAAAAVYGKGKDKAGKGKGKAKVGCTMEAWSPTKPKGKGKSKDQKGKGSMAEDEFKKWAKTKRCSRIDTPEGCKFGDNCFFSHTLAKDNERKGMGGVAVSFATPHVVALENCKKSPRHEGRFDKEYRSQAGGGTRQFYYNPPCCNIPANSLSAAACVAQENAEPIKGCRKCTMVAWSLPSVECTMEPWSSTSLAMPSVHDLYNHPQDASCDICDQTRLKEAPARKKRKDAEEEAKIHVFKFGDLVHLDTLFLTESSDGKLERSEAWTKMQMQVFMDQKTRDIEAFETKQRDWRTIRDCIVEFGGTRHAIDRIYSDRAREFRKACRIDDCTGANDARSLN